MTTKPKADEEAMGSLHGELATVLSDLMKGTLDPETGVRIPPGAAILSVARQFLKDNGIDAIRKQGSPLDTLSNLPVFDDDNVVSIKGHAQR